MNDDKSIILDKLQKDELINYIKKLNLNNLLVFGSVLTNEFNESSDVDIAVLANEKLSINDILNLELFLEDMLNRSIDVVDLNSEKLDLFIKINILNYGKTIYSSDNNKRLENLVDQLEWCYRENENFFYYRRRDLLS